MKPLTACLLALLVLLLPACQSSLISDLAVQPGEKLFWDDFSDTSGNWPQISDMNGSLGIADGTYHIKVQSTHFEVLAVPGHTLQDVQVEVDAARMAGPDQNLFGIACRSSNVNNLYFFTISSDGYYALGKIRNGKTSLLGQEMMAYNAAIVQGSGPNHLRLDCVGKTLKGSINGQVIAIGRDAELSSGNVGLVAGTLDIPGVEVAFDNFIVYKP
jgi:hypothetical protein